MLELRDIRKTYVIGDIETKALDGVSLNFREREFVAILGVSGSGKTTCLNIIGGLDRCDSGELVIKGRHTRNFSDHDWDAYRNNSIGFVFQSYNLITHLSIVANVELGMTLSGVSKAEKRARALEVLRQVGLGDHLHKKPNQLSGGQMQRVAIARALANDPEILLCDEPTGALDSATSVQILDLIRELSKDRLVIMVTHNARLAEQYAGRLIRFSDGRVVSDSNPDEGAHGKQKFSLKKTSMRFITALGLSFNNLRTKLGRTFLTCFASSIGIIGIALILSLSSGFQEQIDQYQAGAMAEFPIIITRSAMEVDLDAISARRDEMEDIIRGTVAYADTDEVVLYDPEENTIMHDNVFTDAFIDYLEDIDPGVCNGIGYIRAAGMNMLRRTDGGVVPVSLDTFDDRQSDYGSGSAMTSMGLTSYPTQLDGSETSFLERNYALLYGAYPAGPTDIVLVVDSRNRADYAIFRDLGFKTDGVETIKFSDIVGTEWKLVANDDYYVKTEYGSFLPGTDYEAMYASGDAVTLRVCAVVRQKEDTGFAVLSPGFCYSDGLAKLIIGMSSGSEIVRAQEASDLNVITMQPFGGEEEKEQMLAYLGGSGVPYAVFIYPKDFSTKDQITAYLDAYNAGRDTGGMIFYTDLAATISDMTGSIMDGITIVLIAFAAISLVVSLIMICIITYTSVLERTKEIGILRALGARKKDITRVFDAETCILGVFSGLLGVFIAWLLTFPANAILYKLTQLEDVAGLRPDHAVFLVLVSTVLTMLGGHIPAKLASRKDAVEALRSE